jgi:hypothetical protein
MKQHAIRTAMTLYESGTLELETAANQAGVSVDRLRRAVRRAGGSEPTVSAEPDRVPLQAD